jgi:hypothetical protein
VTTGYADDLLFEPEILHRPHKKPGLTPLTFEILENEVTQVADPAEDDVPFDEAVTLDCGAPNHGWV